MGSIKANKLPKRITGLNDLAYNLWWSWHPEARELFKILDRRLWKVTGHNAVRFLQEIAPHRLVAAAEDSTFLHKYDLVIGEFKDGVSQIGSWCQESHANLHQSIIAYFSMEFAVHNSLPMYAGGLGALAGDYCKEASDLGLPMISIGFMYPQGYFRQCISDEGWQQEVYEHLNFDQAPIIRILDKGGQPVKAGVDLDGRTVNINVWQVDVGRVKLYLLDTNVEGNCSADCQLTARLYGGDSDTRLQQEIILGIGGVRILRALGINPSVWHANEGHAAFMMLERCREWVNEGLDFSQALARVKSSTVFTTHTPVAAGNDAFGLDLMEKYFRQYWKLLGISRDEFMRLGKVLSNDSCFNMTVLGLRTAERCNGVSQLHGSVCRNMWHGIWPEHKQEDVPINAVTNGIHVPTWIAPQMARLYEKHLGLDWLIRHDDPELWERVEDIPDEELWAAHRWLKSKLIGAARDRARGRWGRGQDCATQVLAMGALLDAEVLTIGFSRRFTTYKRAALILSNTERLKRLLHNSLQPLQVVFAGKAHPHDHQGKCLIQEVYKVARNPEFCGRIAFIEDYDMHMTRYLVQGVDVWLNTPRQLQEASGTSGMKAALNGIPHLSVLDGWWYEAYNGYNGWAIGCDVGQTESGEQDTLDADELYQLLENRVIPLYYDRDRNGVPHGWIRVMKEAIRTNAHRFSARRMLKEYVEQMYLPSDEAGDKGEGEALSVGKRS